MEFERIRWDVRNDSLGSIKVHLFGMLVPLTKDLSVAMNKNKIHILSVLFPIEENEDGDPKREALKFDMNLSPLEILGMIYDFYKSRGFKEGLWFFTGLDYADEPEEDTTLVLLGREQTKNDPPEDDILCAYQDMGGFLWDVSKHPRTAKFRFFGAETLVSELPILGSFRFYLSAIAYPEIQDVMSRHVEKDDLRIVRYDREVSPLEVLDLIHKEYIGAEPTMFFGLMRRKKEGYYELLLGPSPETSA